MLEFLNEKKTIILHVIEFIIMGIKDKYKYHIYVCRHIYTLRETYNNVCNLYIIVQWAWPSLKSSVTFIGSLNIFVDIYNIEVVSRPRR